MNAIRFILSEHNKIRTYLSKISKSKSSQSLQKTFDKLSKFLIRHETMEQKVWYPFLKKNPKLKKTVMHLVGEEKAAAKVIKKIKKIKSNDDFTYELISLKKSVAHHAKEEELKLLPKVKKLIDDSELKIIGKKMSEFKKAYDQSI